VRAESDTLVDEVKSTDVLVIGAPMYNFGIPYTLKTWFDYVVRADVTFRDMEAGSEGLCASTCGPWYFATTESQSGSDTDRCTSCRPYRHDRRLAILVRTLRERGL
jgi:putative NADPH-quinone reductase